MSEPTRSRSIVRLLARLLWLRGGFALPVLGLVVALGVVVSIGCREPKIGVATFNIRNFPEEGNPGQIEGAFETIEGLDVPVVAVQEIRKPRVFAAAAREQLGSSWQAEFGPYRDSERLLLPGVLFDTDAYELDYARRHRDTRVDGVGRPTLEARLVSTRDEATLRVFVVHLKSGGANAELRRKQVAALTPLVRRAVDSSDEVVVLGDFNATGEPDRETLARFADETGLRWATEGLACTAYWRPQGKCQGSALDHVFTSRPAREATARGPCETVGCEPGDSCPVFYDQVSDHCPVTASF